MDVNEVLQLVDRLVVKQTGKHLDDVQRAVVEGTWQRQTYDEISQSCHVSKNYVAEVGSELWQLLSKVLDENIKKTNFVSTIERIYIDSYNNNSNFYQVDGSNNHFSYPQTLNKASLSNHLNGSDINSQPKSTLQDLTLAPQVINFYSRDSDLQTLDDWIFNQKTRLVAVLGVSGIGKTTLVKRFVDVNSTNFEVIIWKSLKYPKSLELLIQDLLQVCQVEAKPTIDDRLKQLLDILTERKCCIILDDVQQIFLQGEFAGQYQPKYQDYQNFFQLITEISHQSTLILISQEKCAEMDCLDRELYPIKSLELSGLNDIEMLKSTGLKNQESWLELIKLYEGNPVYLKNVAGLIKNIFDGQVADFLEENRLLITQDMPLAQLFNRLSPVEQQLVLALSKFCQPVTREDLIQALDLSSMDLIQGLQSLQKRYLLQKITGAKVRFNLSPVFREYVRNSGYG
ncbi:AAA family ATPase [Limnospira fusiformis]|uniref:AAA family ATPase n=1 Tax=Limnospira fusiformis TaxID=54297 RepID=UPI002AA25F75|nr:NB-ARC domain-containing protein [Limnospira fusiformis LS22]